MCFTLRMSLFLSCDDAEGPRTPVISWGIWEFQVSSLQCFRPAWWSSYLSPTTNHWHSHWQKPTTAILRSPRESYDSGSSRCKIKRTWAFLIFLALKMWLTWYQVVDHVCYLQSNMASSIDDSLNTKVSPFFDTLFPSSYWPRTKSTSSIKHAHQPLPTISLPLHRLPKDNIDKVRCHKLFSHYTRSIGTYRNMYLIYLPIRSLSFSLMARGFLERVQYPLQPSFLWTHSSTSLLGSES